VKLTTGYRILFLGTIMVLGFLLACSAWREHRARAFVKPLRIGYEWIGTMTKFDSTGAALLTQRIAEKIVGDTVIDGETWFLSRFIKGNDSSEYRLFSNRRGGLWSRPVSVDRQEALDPELCVPFSVEVGDTFRTLDSRLATVREVFTKLKTRVGDCDCIVYRQEYPDHAGYRDDFYAVDIGLVRAESYRNRPGLKPYLDWRYDIDIVFLPGGSWWTRD
jgi:hypothetical protein